MVVTSAEGESELTDGLARLAGSGREAMPDLELLPGSYDLEVHYFLRAHADDREQSVARQAESTRPSIVRWEAETGWVYRLSAAVSGAKPSQTTPPQRHIPRSRALGTTWWGLEESEWRAQVEPFAPWEGLEGMLVEQRSAWQGYAARRP